MEKGSRFFTSESESSTEWSNRRIRATNQTGRKIRNPSCRSSIVMRASASAWLQPHRVTEHRARGPEYYRTPEPPAPATRCPPAGGGRGGRGRSNLAQLILFVQRQEAHPHTSASLAATPVSRVLGNCRCSTPRHSLRAARTDGCKRQPERRVPGPCRRAASMESSNPYVVVASAWRTTCWSSATVRPSMTSRLFSACRRRYHRGGVEVGAGRSAKGPVAGNPAPPPPSQSRSTPCPRAGSPCIGVTNPSRHPGAPSLSR
jgi:hypothetical protein